MHNFFKKWTPKILLIFILILAAFLRLYKIGDYMTFLGDEGRDVLVVYNILHGHFTLLGPTSSVGGFFLGPIYYYFMAPFLWIFNYNAAGPAVMVALFGIATVWFVYFLGSKFFGQKAGLVASFLYAISPLVIAYSRSSWNPNPVPFFTLATLFSLYKGLSKKSSKYFIFSGFLFGILMQLHYLATFVGLIMGLYVIFTELYTFHISNKRIIQVIPYIAKDYFKIFVGFIVGFSPFLAFEIRHGFLNIIGIIKFIFHSKDVTLTTSGNQVNYFGIVQNVFFRLFGRLATDFPPPEQVSLHASQNIFIWYTLTLLLGLISFGYLVVLLSLAYRKNQEKFLQYLLLVTWFSVGILLFGFYRKPIYDYYFEFLFPVPFLLIGNFVQYLIKRNIFLKLLGSIIVISLGYINLQAMPFRYPPNRQFYQAESISKFVLSKTDNKPYNFALISGGDSDFAYRYFFTIWNRPPVTIENTIVDPKRTTVTNQLLVVCEMNPCAPLGNSLWEIAGFGRAEIAGHWDISVVQVYRLTHYVEKPIKNPHEKKS